MFTLLILQCLSTENLRVITIRLPGSSFGFQVAVLLQRLIFIVFQKRMAFM